MFAKAAQCQFYLTLIICFLQAMLSSGFYENGQWFDNVALQKTTRQIGDHSITTGSSNAVDQNARDTCAFAYSRPYYHDGPAWWQVDLGEFYTVKKITIVAPITEDYIYLSNFMVTLSPDDRTDSSIVCAIFNDTESLTYGTKLTLNCSIDSYDGNATNPMGRFLTIINNRGSNMRYLSMCDVQVFGVMYTGIKNKAFEKTTRQSGTWQYHGSSDKAVDSDKSTCALAETTDGSLAWWQVDLGQSYAVDGVDIVVNDVDDAYKYLQYFMIMVKDSYYDGASTETNDQYKCVYYSQAATLAPNQSYVNLKLKCEGGYYSQRNGRYVTIKRLGGKEPSKLALCDVKVNVACRGSQCFAPDVPIIATNPYGNGWPTTTTYMYRSYTDYPFYSQPYYYYYERGLRGGDIAAIVLGIVLFFVLAYSIRITYLHFRNRCTRTNGRSNFSGECDHIFWSFLSALLCKKKATSSTDSEVQVSSAKKYLINDTY